MFIVDDAKLNYEFKLGEVIYSMDALELSSKLETLKDIKGPIAIAEALQGVLGLPEGTKLTPTQGMMLLNDFNVFMESKGEELKKLLGRLLSSTTSTVSPPETTPG